MRGITIIVGRGDPGRLHAALSVAAAQAALGRSARLFLQADAVALVRDPINAPEDARYAAAGLPTLEDMLAEVTAMGVSITACQSGLALAGIDAGELPKGVETGGLIELLSSSGDDQLLFV